MLPIDTIQLQEILELTNQTYQAITSGIGQENVLFMGGTGVGKSTLLNQLFGSNINLVEDLSEESLGGFNALVEDNQVEHFKIGIGNTSETLFPNIKKLPDSTLNIVDLAGCPDNRGTVKAICAANSIDILNKSLPSLKGLVFVAEINSLTVERGKALAEKIEIIAKIMKNNLGAIKDSVALVITKTDGKKIPAKNISNFIKACIEREKKDPNPSELKKNTIKVLEQLAESSNIFVPDITDQSGKSRNGLIQMIAGLKTIDTKDLDFSEIIENQAEFKQMLIKAAKSYLNTLQSIKDKKNKSSELSILTEKYKEQIAKLKLEKGQFDETRKIQLKQLKDEKDKLTTTNNQIEDINTKIRKAEKTIQDINNLTNYSHIIHTETKDQPATWVPHKTGQMRKHKGKNHFNMLKNDTVNYKNVSIHKPRKGVRTVSYEQRSGESGSLPIVNNNSFNVKLIVLENAYYNATNGILLAPNSSINLTYALGQNSHIKYQLAAQELNAPENIKAKSDEEHNKKSYEEELKKEEKEQVKLNYSINDIQERLNQDNSSIKVGEHNKSIEVLEQKSRDSNEQFTILNNEITTLEQELNNKQNDFDVVRKLVTTLKLDNEPTIKSFVNDYLPSTGLSSSVLNPNRIFNTSHSKEEIESINTKLTHN